MDDYLNQQSKKYSLSYNDAVKYLSILLIAKFFKSFGIYLCYDLLKHIHLVQLLFFSLFIASIIYIILQKPFKSGDTGNSQQQLQKNNNSSSSTNQFNKRLYRPQYIRIFKYSLVQTFIKLLFFFGLTQCGPLRTTLLFEQSEIAVLCALKAIFLSQTNPSRTRGVIVLLTAILILLAFDYDDLTKQASQAAEHPEGRHHGIISHIFYFLISFFNVADHKAGVLLLVFALFLQISFNQSSLSKFLITEVGGAKRLRALSTCFSALILSPWAIFNLFTSVLDPFGTSTDELSTNDLANHSWFYYIFPVFLISLFLFVIDFYVESFVQQKTDSVYTSKFGSLFVFTSSLFLSFVWNHPHMVKIMVMDKIKTIIEQEHALSWGVIIAYLFFILSTNMLTRPLIKHKGSFIGYSSVGSPLYSLTGETLKRTSMSMVTVIKNVLREVVNNQDSRRIFYFLCLNLTFTFVELSYGSFSNSLGLISDGVHMLFDCSALVMGLFAAVVSQWKPTRIYSYGFGRVEILSGFINGLFLVVISIFVFIEAIHRLVNPPEIESGKLIYVSFAGLCVNLFGLFAFSHAHTHGGMACESHSHSDHSHPHSHSHGGGGGSHGHSHGGGSSCSHTHSHSHSHSPPSSNPSMSTDNDNMKGVYLHVLADTMGSVGVIISSLLIQHFGWYIADPLCSICIAIMIFLSVIPLLKHSSSLLLLRTPSNKEAQFKSLLQRILFIDGVVSYRDDHLWQLSSSSYVATIHVQITPNSYEQLITSQIHGIFKEMKLSNLTIQVEREVFFQHLSGLGASLGQIDNGNVVLRTSNLNNTDRDSAFINIEKFI